MAESSTLAFSRGLIDKYIQFKQYQAQETFRNKQLELQERRETRYDTQLQGNRRFAVEGRRQAQTNFEATLASTEKYRGEMLGHQKQILFATQTQRDLERKGKEEGRDYDRRRDAISDEMAEESHQLKLDDPSKKLAGLKYDVISGLPPGEQVKALSSGTTVNISAGEREKMAAGLASIDVLNNLRDLYDLPDTRTGPAVGRLDPLIGQVGLTSRNQEDFMAATSAFKNQIIKEITGAQMSETEALRIMKQVPDITDHPTRWEAKWRQSIQNIKFLQGRRQEIQSGKEPTPWVSPSEAEFGPRATFPRKEVNVDEIDLTDFDGMFE